MKSPQQLKQEAAMRASGLVINPNSQAAQEMMQLQQAQAMAARLIIESASSIYVRMVSAGVPEAELADVARYAFKAGQVLLAVLNEPAPEPAPPELPDFVPTAHDANGSPVEP